MAIAKGVNIKSLTDIEHKLGAFSLIKITPIPNSRNPLVAGRAQHRPGPPQLRPRLKWFAGRPGYPPLPASIIRRRRVVLWAAAHNPSTLHPRIFTRGQTKRRPTRKSEEGRAVPSHPKVQVHEGCPGVGALDRGGRPRKTPGRDDEGKDPGRGRKQCESVC